MSDTVSIAAVLPFWNYAVCPTNGHNPGIPFYTEKGAREFFNETRRVLPWCGSILVKRKRRLFRRSQIEVMQEYSPELNPLE